MTDPAPIPAALVKALAIRNRRRSKRSQWVILPNAADPVDSMAASINAAKHQRLSDGFKPEGWIVQW
jgi:hypothetical protein